MPFSMGPGPLAILPVIVLLATVGGRLLGIRLRWWRSLAATFPGLVIGIVFIYALEKHSSRPETLPTVPVLLAALVATMLIAATLELLARPGRLAGVQGRLAVRGIPHPVRSLRARAGRARRYLQVTRIAGRHGLAASLGAPHGGPLAQAHSLGRNLRLTLEECGGIFVKLGQVLSTRPDLLPAGVIGELTGLQDNVAAVPRAEIEAILAAELGAPAEVVFAWFDPAPLAAASIAQAHRARLASGEEVVVKVQRPGIRALVERDLGILLKLTRTLEARASWARNYRLADMASGFAEALREELDFRIEARNIAAVAGTTTLRVPAVHAALSTSRVLVMEWLDGVSARNAGVLLERNGADRAMLARTLLACILRQVMLEGTFHADPHPGNVLILKDSQQLALIDFGSVGRLDPLQQAGLRRLLMAVARRNPGELHDALLDLAEARGSAGPGDELLERALANS
jgi:ubiquinone biosynthesis protein